MKPLTPRQAEILAFLARFQTEQGYSASLRDIMRAFGFRSTNAAIDHLSALERKGWIARARTIARCVRILALPVPEVAA